MMNKLLENNMKIMTTGLCFVFNNLYFYDCRYRCYNYKYFEFVYNNEDCFIVNICEDY